MWLCIYFPGFSLQALKLTNLETEPYAVFVETAGQCVVEAVSSVAKRAGVDKGMVLSAAYVLCPELISVPRRFYLENKMINALAVWAMRYSSQVSIITSDAMVLEIKGSLRLFGNASLLCNRIKDELSGEWKLYHTVAVTPAPTASLLLARHNKANQNIPFVKTLEELKSVLGALKIYAVGLDNKTVSRFITMGVRQLSELWRLPRSGLSCRFGECFMQWMDGLLGVSESPLVYFRTLKSFSAVHAFSIEIKECHLMLPVLQRLVHKLGKFLQNNDAGVEKIEIEFEHVDASATTMAIVLNSRSRDGERIIALVRERLATIKFKMPVVALRLIVKRVYAYHGSNRDLFEYDLSGSQLSGVANHALWCELIEQFQARMGVDTVNYLEVIADHRPEKAWCYKTGIPVTQKITRVKILATNLLSIVNSRPIWMLPKPLRLMLSQGRLVYQGQVLSLQEAERIESGWWDGADIRRDYYLAINDQGVRYWVYRDLEPRHPDHHQKNSTDWYLHGIFA